LLSEEITFVSVEGGCHNGQLENFDQIGGFWRLGKAMILNERFFIQISQLHFVLSLRSTGMGKIVIFNVSPGLLWLMRHLR